VLVLCRVHVVPERICHAPKLRFVNTRNYSISQRRTPRKMSVEKANYRIARTSRNERKARGSCNILSRKRPPREGRNLGSGERSRLLFGKLTVNSDTRKIVPRSPPISSTTPGKIERAAILSIRHPVTKSEQFQQGRMVASAPWYVPRYAS
jgi:hypothetical protein